MLAFLKKLSVLLVVTLAASASAYSAPKTVLVVGDSLSAEYGIARGAGWVALLDQKHKTEKIPATVVNASISGETTSGGRARLPALLTQYRPAVVVICSRRSSQAVRIAARSCENDGIPWRGTGGK